MSNPTKMFIKLLARRNNMTSVIVSPHPDDEWIGCGCTILKKLDEGEKVRVLIITREPRTERRIKISQQLAKKYKYDLKILGNPEKSIDDEKLIAFFKKNIASNDTVYLPDIDLHADHRKISSVAQEVLRNKKFQYCVYNNSLNIIRRVNNALLFYITKKALPSFRRGEYDIIVDYNLETKNNNIVKFGEVPRGGDVLRRIL